MAMTVDAPTSGAVTDAVTANATVTKGATSAVTVAVTVPGRPSLEVTDSMTDYHEHGTHGMESATDSMTESGRDRCVSGPLGAHLVIPGSGTRHQPVRRHA